MKLLIKQSYQHNYDNSGHYPLSIILSFISNTAFRKLDCLRIQVETYEGGPS
jgi:hypothetical protein